MRVILFNVFPYRDRHIKNRTARVASELAVGVGLAILFTFLVWSDFDDRLQKQTQYLNELATIEAEIASRAARVQTMKDEAQRLRRQVNALESVEKESVQASHVLSYLDKSLPQAVALSRMSFKDSELVINGMADSVPQLAKWVEGMESNLSLFNRVDFVFLRDATRPSEKPPTTDGPHQFEIKLRLTAQNQSTPAVELANVTTR